MTTLKCKICGGNIVLTGESHGVCDSCGNEVTLPRIDDDKRADMYNRGNHFRQLGDFDRAYSAYEHIIADNQSDAEAHWCLTLCRYGVEYVRDARTETYKPTVSRMSYERILDDPDYLAALAASDDYTKELYRRSARQIDDIQRRYLEISRKEQPYDVFICFKAEDENRQRTQANVLSQDIYEQLTAKGVKVFFSRITLESKLSEEYEPYIFAALHSAKVMLLVADSPEQLTARWVKNEWSRYLGMMDRDSSKHIIPVFVNMSPYDFPPEIPTVQGQDMSRLGAMQDLVRGVCKMTGHLSPAPAAAAGGSVSVRNLLSRVKLALEDGEFDVADRLLEDILNREPENGDAYLYRALSKYKLSRLPLEDCEKMPYEQRMALFDDQNFKRALQFADKERKLEMKEYMLRCYELSMYLQAEILLKNPTKADVEQARAKLEELDASVKAENDGVLYYPDKRREMNDLCDERYRKVCEQEELKRRQREQNEQKLQELEKYWEEIGDPETYVRRTLNKKYPADAKKCDWHYRTGSYLEEGKGIAGFVISLIACGIGIALTANGEYGSEAFIFWSIFTMLATHLGVFNESDFSFKYYIISTIVLCVAVVLLSIFIPAIVTTLIILVIPAALVIGLLFRTVATIRETSGRSKAERAYKKIMQPRSKELVDDVKKRWVGRVGEGNLIPLADYNKNFPQDTVFMEVESPVAGEVAEIGQYKVVYNKGDLLATIRTGSGNVDIKAPCDGWAISRASLDKGDTVAKGRTIVYKFLERKAIL